MCNGTGKRPPRDTESVLLESRGYAVVADGDSQTRKTKKTDLGVCRPTGPWSEKETD